MSVLCIVVAVPSKIETLCSMKSVLIINSGLIGSHQVYGGLPEHAAVAAPSAGGPPCGADVGQVGVVAPQDARHRTQGRQRGQDEISGWWSDHIQNPTVAPNIFPIEVNP